MTEALRSAALALVERTSWSLFPTVGKVPVTGRGFYDATNDPAALASLFDEHPDADGLAVACGASGLVVLDADVKSGLDGRDSLAEAGLPWTEPVTPRASTPRGGEHALFAGRAPSRNGALPGVDIKAVGGYVVLPPGPGRLWQADASPWDVPLAPAPVWLLALAGPARDLEEPRWTDALGAYIGEGARNETAASIAGKLVYHHVPDRLVALLVVSWARSFCEPPMADREALTVVRSILRRDRGSR